MSRRGIEKATSELVAASDRLYRAARGRRRDDAKLAAMLITAIASSVRDGTADAELLRVSFLHVAGQAERAKRGDDAGE